MKDKQGIKVRVKDYVRMPSGSFAQVVSVQEAPGTITTKYLKTKVNVEVPSTSVRKTSVANLL